MLEQSPGNANGLSGLGAIARLEGNYQQSKAYFDQVLEHSPSHLPALIGGADIRWLMGLKEGAVVLYHQIPPSSAFYDHAQRRIAEFRGRGVDEGERTEHETDGEGEPPKSDATSSRQGGQSPGGIQDPSAVASDGEPSLPHTTKTPLGATEEH